MYNPHMNILITYATYSTGTESAVRVLESVLTPTHTVTVKQILSSSLEEMKAADLTVLASPSWDLEGKEGQPHEDYLLFMRQSEGKTTPGKKFAILGLGDSTYTYFCGAVTHLEEFVKKLGGTLTTPSLKIDGYFFNQAANDEKIKEWAAKLTT